MRRLKLSFFVERRSIDASRMPFSISFSRSYFSLSQSTDQLLVVRRYFDARERAAEHVSGGNGGRRGGVREARGRRGKKIVEENTKSSLLPLSTMRSQSLFLALRGASSLAASTSTSSSSSTAAAAVSGFRRYHKNVSRRERERARRDFPSSFVRRLRFSFG